MNLRYWLAILLLALSSGLLLASATPEDVKDKLEARYKQQKLNVVPPKIMVRTYQQMGFKLNELDFHVHYVHFAPGVEMPARSQKLDLFDDHTTQRVEGLGASDFMEPGEAVLCRHVVVVKRGNFLLVQLLLAAISIKKVAATGRQGGFGVDFLFVFPGEVFESGNYEAIVREISPYFLPEAEYNASVAAASKAAEEGKNVNIQPGMSREQVIKALGDPLKTITFGKKTILKYKDITVELEDDKVTDVKAN